MRWGGQALKAGPYPSQSAPVRQCPKQSDLVRVSLPHHDPAAAAGQGGSVRPLLGSVPPEISGAKPCPAACRAAEAPRFQAGHSCWKCNVIMVKGGCRICFGSFGRSMRS